MLVAALAVGACDYVVVPPEDERAATAVNAEGWSAVPTAIGPGDDGALRIDLAIENDTGAWSAMAAIAGKRGATARRRRVDRSTARRSSSGPAGIASQPGFQMRGFVGGTKTEPAVETIRVECAGRDRHGARREARAIDYDLRTGDYDYYDTDATRTDADRSRSTSTTLAADLTYPIAIPVDGLIQPPDTPITAINDVVLTPDRRRSRTDDAPGR